MKRIMQVVRMRLDFFLWLAGTRLAEAFQWIFSSRPGFRLALCASAILLSAQMALVLSGVGGTMPKDTAEHLSMVYALERGEIPYREFPQNHPLLFNLLLLQLKGLFGATDVSDAYLLSKAFIGLHIIACFALFVCVLRRICEREFGDARRGFIFIMMAPLLGIWWYGGFWYVRPDWIAYFYAYLAAVSHLLMMRNMIQGGRHAGWLILGAVSCGFGAAVLSKVVYVIVPYMMTLCLAALASPGYWLKTLSGKRMSLFLINVVFVALSLLFFVGFVAYELRATGANITDYIISNYVMNADRFISYSDLDRNPFAHIRVILGLPMVMVYILVMSWFPLLLMLHDRRKHLFKYAVLFAGLTVLFNASFPVYSNGVTWTYYFIPSLMAIALYMTVVVICLLHCIAPGLQAANRSRRLDAGQGVAAFQLALAFIILLTMATPSVLKTGRMAKKSYGVAQKIMESSEPFFAAEGLMPSDLRYWKLGWNFQPVAAPAWGYFVQFNNIRGFWRKLHKLGVAPDPVAHWRAEYEKFPPEAIGVGSLEELKKYARKIQDMQNIDVGWLLDRVRKDYSCISRGRPFLMRNDLAQAYLQKGGWRLCSEGGD